MTGFPLDRSALHIAIDMQRLFAERTVSDDATGIQAETTFRRTLRPTWPKALTAAEWLHKTALRLNPQDLRALRITS